MKKKILIFDVDGTICESCEPISVEMSDTLNNLKEEYILAFISGSTINQIYLQLSQHIVRSHHLLGTSGCNYSKVKEGELIPIYTHTLNTEEKKEIITAFEDLMEEFDIITLTTRDDQLQDRDSQITLSALGRHAPADLKKDFDPFHTKRKKWVEFLSLRLSSQKYDIKIGGTTSIDITKKGFDKGMGIKKFAEYNKFKLNDILFFGDNCKPGGNDYAATKYVECVEVTDVLDTILKLRRFQ